MTRRTRRLILAGAVTVVAAAAVYHYFRKSAQPPAPAQMGCGVHCGTERWGVKTLSDPDSVRVNFSLLPETVDGLISQPAPPQLPADARIAPAEERTYIVTAHLVGFKLEDDQDIHIVIADLDQSSETMIVEIPSTDCSEACSSAHFAEFVNARAAFVARFGEPHTRFQRVPGNVTVTVTGVGFFDFLHHQTGVAPDGFELHPVLNIQFP
jgi:hypothetical protein